MRTNTIVLVFRIVIALVAMTLCATGSARAAATEFRSTAGKIADACRAYNAARRYAESLAYCTRARETYRLEGTRGASAFVTSLAVAEMGAYLASDRLGLGQRPLALATALEAHRLLRLLGATLPVPLERRGDVLRLAADLVRLEAASST